MIQDHASYVVVHALDFDSKSACDSLGYGTTTTNATVGWVRKIRDMTALARLVKLDRAGACGDTSHSFSEPIVPVLRFATHRTCSLLLLFYAAWSFFEKTGCTACNNLDLPLLLLRTSYCACRRSHGHRACVTCSPSTKSLLNVKYI